MAERTLQAKLKVRSDTATNWQSNNPVLLQGEPAFETDTNKLKFGDGTSAYNDLPYISGDAITVEANPTDEATDSLTKIKVNDITYQIPTSLEGMYLLDDIVGGTEPVADGTIEIDTTDLGFELAVNTRIQYYWTQEDGSKSLYVYAHVQSVETNVATLYIDNVLNLGAGGGVPVIDLGTLSSFQLGSEASAEATITAEQAEQLASSDYSVLSFTTSDGYKMFVPKMVGFEEKGTAAHIFGCSLEIDSAASWGVLCQVMQTTVYVNGAVIYTTRVEANPSDTATQTLQKLRVKNSVYSIPQGTEVIDLGTVTLTGTDEEASGTVTVTSEQVTKMKAETPPIVNFEMQGGITYSLSRLMVVPNSGGGKDLIIFSGTYAGRSQDDGAVIHCAMLNVSAGSTITANISISTIYQTNEESGVEVVDLGTIEISNKQGSVTLTSEQFTKLTTSPYPQAKMVLSELDMEGGITYQPANVSLNFLMQANMTGNIQAYYSGMFINGDWIVNILLVVLQDEGAQTYSASVAITTKNISGTDGEIPTGGLAGQVLTKQSGTDYDVAWTTVNATEPTVITEEAYAEALAAGTIENDKLYYIQGTSDNTLATSAQTTTYDNATSGLTATNVQAAIDEVKADIPANGDFTLAGLSEKSYNNLTDKPTIPTVDLSSIATALGLTTTQLNNLITFAKSITSADTSGTTVNNEFTARSFDTTA